MSLRDFSVFQYSSLNLAAPFVVYAIVNQFLGTYHHLRRLRRGHRIVGFARMENGQLYYSRDSFWWSGIVIHHDEKDEFCGYRTADGRLIFSDDIVTFKPLKWYQRKQYYVVSHDSDGWHLKQLFGTKTLPLTALDRVKQLQVVSHAFLQETTICAE